MKKIYRSIKELVIDAYNSEGAMPSYERLTALVREYFPNSKWQKTHYVWYKSQIKTGRLSIANVTKQSENTTSDIFISYKREEQAIARKLANALESEGWSVWWDPKLRAGEHFDDVIEKALNEAKCVIVMWSKLSVQSRYVRSEATYALEQDKLVPVRIENANLPFRFRGIHTLSFLGWDGAKDFSEFRRLVGDISSFVAPRSIGKQEVPAADGQQSFAVPSLDNAVFLRERESAWSQFCSGRVWAIACITPLSINGDSIDPLSACVREVYNGLRVFGDEPANRTFTRPSEHGLVNEDLRNLSDGNGHRIEVFRNGHCEYLLCLQGSVDQITEELRGRGIPLDADKVIRYTDLADTIKNQLGTLFTLQRKCLPFGELTLTWMLANVSKSIMYSQERPFTGPVFGFPVTAAQLLYREVVNVNDPGALIEQTIRRAVNNFGLVLDSLYDSDGRWQRPKRMS
jgi:TIR domain